MKNKKILKLLLVIIITIGSFALIFKTSPVKVKADSGFDSSYDSGSSWDSGSSYDSGSSWGSGSSSYGSSSSGGSIEGLIVFVVVIVIIVLATKGKINLSGVSTTSFILDHTKEKPDDEVSKLIPGFNKEEFLQNRYLDYLEIQRSWTDFDYDTIRSMVTDELYNQYEMQLDTLKIKNEKNVMSDFIYKDAMITDISDENNKITITMELICEFYDYIEKLEARKNVIICGL